MTLGTPHERYDPESASILLRSVGEHYVSVATKNLLSRGILSKLIRDPQKQKPGRQLKISEVYVCSDHVELPHSCITGIKMLLAARYLEILFKTQ